MGKDAVREEQRLGIGKCLCVRHDLNWVVADPLRFVLKLGIIKQSLLKPRLPYQSVFRHRWGEKHEHHFVIEEILMKFGASFPTGTEDGCQDEDVNASPLAGPV